MGFMRNLIVREPETTVTPSQISHLSQMSQRGVLA